MNARTILFQAIPAGSSEPIGVIVCKQSMHKHASNRGYIAMLSVDKSWRKRGVGALYQRALTPDYLYLPTNSSEHPGQAIRRSHETTWGRRGVSQNTPFGILLTYYQVVLETEYDNAPALSLYESLGFIREKRLYRFYLNGKDAFRLVLAVPPPELDHDLPHYMKHAPTTAILSYPIAVDDDEVSCR
jgi:N-alpha-acetyltransferase 30